MVLRFTGRRELRHGRQAARGDVGDRTVGAAVRHEPVGRAGTAGADRRRHGGRAVRHSAARGVRPATRRRGRTAGRCDAGRHAGGGADLPVQQSRRTDGAVDGPRRVLRDAGDADGIVAMAGAGRRRVGVRLPDEDVRGRDGAARLRVVLPVVRADVGAETVEPLADRGGRAVGVGRLVGAHRGAVARQRPPLHQQLHRQQRAQSGSRIQRGEPDPRPQQDTARHRGRPEPIAPRHIRQQPRVAPAVHR